MEKVIVVSGLGFCATDESQYSTINALNAAGKTAFPGLEAQGLYPSSIAITSVASGGGAGDEFTFVTNWPVGNTSPSIGVQVHGAGQQFVEGGVTIQTSTNPISNIYICSKKTSGDSISIAAFYG